MRFISTMERRLQRSGTVAVDRSRSLEEVKRVPEAVIVVFLLETEGGYLLLLHA